MMRFWIVFLMVGLVAALQAQDYRSQFNRGKELFAEGNFSEAIDTFNGLIVYDMNNPYSEYASYYSALAAQRLGFTALAKSHLSHIRKTYPKWTQLSEVNIWLAKLFFVQGEYFQAMRLLKEVNNGQLTSIVDSMKMCYLSKLDDVETLKMLREENPRDVEVDRALVRAIAKQGFTTLDAYLFDSLIQRNRWKRQDFWKDAKPRSELKDRYRVAVLFPFNVRSLEPSPEKKKNQPILDLYQGMRFAADSMERAGIHIDLLAYDTERDPAVTKKVLEKEELKTVDLIIGPLFAEEAKEVQLFSKSNEINLLANPVSSNSDFLSDNPYAILYQPSHETIGKRSAEMVAAKVRNKYSLVYFGSTKKDSLLAFNYMKRALELGVKIVYAEEVRRETSNGILEKLAKATKYDEWKNPLEFTMKRDSIGSIFVASDDPVIYTKVINSVETRSDSILVVGQEVWLDDTSVDYGKFEKTRIVFASPSYNPMEKKGSDFFRNGYMKKYGLLPSNNVKSGYDVFFTIGQILYKYGAYFQDGLTIGPMFEGALTTGFKLEPGRDNGIVPFIVFRNGLLIPFN